MKDELKLHKVVVFTTQGKERIVRFPISESAYKVIKKMPKGVQKEQFTDLYDRYVKDLNEHRNDAMSHQTLEEVIARFSNDLEGGDTANSHKGNEA